MGTFKVIGLTGGIASGKSTVTKLLGTLGATTIDADKLGHKVYEPGTACFREVVAAFSDAIVNTDGTINRKSLGEIVYSDEAQMARLSGICWPYIREMLEAEIEAARESATAVAPGTSSGTSEAAPSLLVFEAAVLVEAGWEDLADEVWVVHVSHATAQARLMSRNGISPAEADKRIHAQISNEERFAVATRKILNEGDLAELGVAVQREFARLMPRSAIAPLPPPPPQSLSPSGAGPREPPKFNSIEEEMDWWKEEQARLTARQTADRMARLEAEDLVQERKKQERALARPSLAGDRCGTSQSVGGGNTNDFLSSCPEASKSTGLNQYWYSSHTIDVLTQEAVSHGSVICCLSTPSIYFSLPAALQRVGKVFDYDDQWADKPGFVKYDFNQPEDVPTALRETFDFIIIDPPFITHEVWAKYAATVKLLLKPNGKVLCTTIDENRGIMEEHFGAKPVQFRPSIPNLVYQYSVYCNYESDGLSVRNEEVPAEPLLSQL